MVLKYNNNNTPVILNILKRKTHDLKLIRSIQRFVVFKN